jgi:hypothetical protein
LLSELVAPFPDGLTGHPNPAIEHHLLDVSIAQGKSVIKSDTVDTVLNVKGS